MEGITSIAFSLASFTIKEFQPAANYALKLIQQLIENPLPEATLLNVNIPPRFRARNQRSQNHSSGYQTLYREFSTKI